MRNLYSCMVLISILLNLSDRNFAHNQNLDTTKGSGFDLKTEDAEIQRRTRRYILHGNRWNRCRLTWLLRDPLELFPSNLEFRMAKRSIRKAMAMWEKASKRSLRLIDVSPPTLDSPLNYRRSSDIDIYFAKLDHGDLEAFDGPGGLVAHSTYPPGGLIHFDASERWTTATTTSTSDKWHPKSTAIREENSDLLNLYHVALHEIGHVLGFRHSESKHSIMNPYYRNFTMKGTEISLDDDDVKAVRELFTTKIKCKRRYKGESEI